MENLYLISGKNELYNTDLRYKVFAYKYNIK